MKWKSTYQYDWLEQQFPHLEPKQVMPFGDALYAFPHRALVDTFTVGCEAFEDEVQVVEVEGRAGALLDGFPEQVPNAELQPFPQYADELPHHPYLLPKCQLRTYEKWE